MANLETGGNNVTGSASYFESFDKITVSASDVTSPVILTLSGSGALDLVEELAIDGGGSRSATVYAAAAGNSVTTGAGDDSLFGNEGADTLNGGAGNDFIDGDASGTGGNDVLAGGSGDDTIYDNYGAVKSIDGGSDNDRISVGFFDNPSDGTVLSGTISGGGGNDIVSVNASDLGTLTFVEVETLATNALYVTGSVSQFESFDHIVVYEGDEFSSLAITLSGGGALDLSDELAMSGGGARSATVFASAAGNSITTGAGDDFLTANSGDDRLDGGAGNDTIYDNYFGSGGNDVLIGGSGDDALQDTYGAVKSIDGGADNDRVLLGFYDDPGDGTVMSGTVAGGSGNDLVSVGHSHLGTLTFTGLETLVTNGYTITGSASQFESFDHIVAYDGDDYQIYPVSLEISGAGSLDLTDELATLDGGSRAATVIASTAGNTITTGAGNDTLYGNVGSDVLNGGAGSDYMDGDAYGDGGNDVLNGGTGADTIIDVFGSVKSISGGSGNDRMMVDNAEDRNVTMSGTIDGGADNDLVVASSGDLGSLNFISVETISAEGAVLTGTVGQFESFDHIIYSESNETYVVTLQLAATGTLDLTDELVVGVTSRAATVIASIAGNTITTGAGDDTLYGSFGSDILNGGGGDDYLDGDVYGNGGNDVLNGGAGDDTLSDISGAVKSIAGDSGNDQIVLDNGEDRSVLMSGIIDGGAGEDAVVIYGNDLGALTFTGVETLLNNGIKGSVEQFESFDHILGGNAENASVNLVLSDSGTLDLVDELAISGGGSRSATVYASITGNSITTGSGDDLLFGDIGSDTLNGGAGDDQLIGWDGTDVAIFNGAYGEYVLTDRTAIDGSFRISSALDGTDTLLDVEFAEFTDGTYDLVNRIFTPSASSTTLETLGATVTKTVAQFEAYERIVTYDQPGALGDMVSLVVSDGGTLDLAGELEGSRGVNIRASDFGNVLITGSKNDILSGGTGNDTLSGGAGSDRMYGLTGNDTFIVDSAGDVVIEYSNQGTDIVRSSVSYSLVSNVENLTLVGTDSIDGFGNSLANVLTGNEAGNTLSGANGNDELIGLEGDDTLDGGVGADSMYGGAGQDTYYVDTRGDGVTEFVDEGIDTVYSSISYVLGQNVENGVLTAANTTSLTGNDADNFLYGNDAANQLIGRGGNDYLDGAGGNDRMLGGLGHDTYRVDSVGDVVIELAGAGTDTVVSDVSYTLSSGVEDLYLEGSAANGTGNSLANHLEGNAGDNILNGEGGNDTLWGGYGNDRLIGGKGLDDMSGFFGDDTYVVDNPFERVKEYVGQGFDAVEASVTFKLGANLEDLLLTGSAAIDGTGNYSANVIGGNGAANTLNGSAGNDTLTGGLGQDTFLFDTALNAKSNVDTITDFRSVDDTIRLENSVFTGLSAGALSGSAFVVGIAATNAAQHIVYNNKTGVLYFDADGSGAGSQVAFAKLDGIPALTASDFFVV